MGHTRLGNLPRTRKWQEVVALIEGGAGCAQVANATITAAERGLNLAAEDKGLVETLWLLTQLPLAARHDDFAGALRSVGQMSEVARMGADGAAISLELLRQLAEHPLTESVRRERLDHWRQAQN